MIRKLYKVLVVALVLVVTRVRVEEADEQWPLEEAPGAEGDNPRAAGQHRLDRALDYNDESSMEPESKKDLVSNGGLHQGDSDGERAHEDQDNSNDDDEVEDFAYDSDIEKINSKTVLEDVNTGKQSRHDKVVPEPLGRQSEFRRKQHWDDKPECVVVRRAGKKVSHKELFRDTRDLATPEPPMYYDMKRAKRRMLAFPRHGSEDRSSWGAKILKALETALNTAAKQTDYNMDQRESITKQYPDKTILTDMAPSHTPSTSLYEEPEKNTFLTDLRLPLPNIDQGESISSTSESSRSEITRTSTRPKQTLSYNDITPIVTLGQNSDKKAVDSHNKREKSYNTWSLYRNNYEDSSEQQEGRMDVMPYSDESRKNVKLQRGRGKSSSSESDEQPVIAQNILLNRKESKGKLLRTATSVALQRTKVFTTTENPNSLIVDTGRTSQFAEALDSSMAESDEKTTRRIKNFYPIKHTSRHFKFESKYNEDDGKSLEKSSGTPSSTSKSPGSLTSTTFAYKAKSKEKSSETNQESSEEYSSDESKNQSKETDEGSSEELGIEFNHQTSSEESSHLSAKESSTHLPKANLLEVSQKPHHHEIHHISSSKLILNTSKIHDQISSRRYNKEIHPGQGKEANKMTPGQGLMADPEFPAPVVVSGMEELFILPDASHPMRRQWESFYKSVSKAVRLIVSLQVAIVLIQYLIVT